MASDQSSLALTSLLTFLHTHLQSQTQLLPTLHTQLGLPASALEDELTTLQQQLAECVDSQIDLRRAQVDEWMAKCEAAEKECGRYYSALGAHVKVTGTLSDLRKEKTLPKRYQLITEHQEKLRQLYYTKLEQLNTLTNRITALTRTLGPNYFPHDLTSTSSPTDDSPHLHRDVSPERFTKLEKELVRGKAEVNKRLLQLQETFLHIDWLYVELGMNAPRSDDPFDIPSSSPPNHHNELGSDPFSMSTPTPAARNQAALPRLFASVNPDVSSSSSSYRPSKHDHQSVLYAFSARVAQAEAEGTELPEGAGLEGVDPTPDLLTWAADTRAELEELKRRRESHIQAMYDQLEALWRRMGIPDADMDHFVDAHQGSTEKTVRAYEDELERMMEYKRERMGEFVKNARDEIVKLWDELMIGEDERADFALFSDDEYSEELLTRHEEEIQQLKEELKQKAGLLANIKKYIEICGEEQELAASAQDQSRLLGRGPRDPGRLLREEKMRKRVNKEKPRLEKELVKAVKGWEAEAGRPFLVNGERILERFKSATSEKEDTAATAKRKQPPGAGAAVSSTRAGSAPPSSTSGYMPTRSGSITPAMRPAEGAAPKRQRTAEPTTVGRPTRAVSAKVPGSVTRSTTKASGGARSTAKVKAGTSTRSVLATTQTKIATNGSRAGSRIPSGASTAAPPAAQKPKRESFKPRPSMEAAVFAPAIDVHSAPKWPGIKEEAEG